MTIPNRTLTLTGVFAKNATTTIPDPPVSGASYRDTQMTKEEVESGWAYKDIVDSSSFNQAMYEYASLTSQMEKYGFLPWSNLTDYDTGSLCLGSNGTIYQAIQATGPSSTAYDPVNDTSNTYWKDFVGSTYVTLATNQTITGDKTFSGSVSLGSYATTDTISTDTDHSTKVVNSQWFRNALTNLGVQHLTKYEDASGLPYTAPIDGIIRVRIGAVYNWEVYINSIIVQQQTRNDADSCTTTWVTVPVKQGDVITANGSIYNVSMYYPY